MTHHMEKLKNCENTNGCQLLEARLCGRGFTDIILTNPSASSARFLRLCFTGEGSRLSQVQGHANGDKETGIRRWSLLSGACVIFTRPTANHWPEG